MITINSMFTKSKIALLSVLLVVFPLFFLPITQEFYNTNKFLFSFVVALLLSTTLLLQLITQRKISFNYSAIDTSVFVLIVVTALSTLISSPNKMSALFHLPVGVAALIVFFVLYLIIKNTPSEQWKVFKPWELLSIGAAITGVISILFYLNPFASQTLSPSIAFLKTPLFNTVGSTLDLMLFSGFFVTLAVARLITKGKKELPVLVAGGIATIVIVLNVYYIVKTNQFRLPPVSQSWLAAIETLKSPQTALFGVGIDNFSGQFTLVKNTAYNSSDLWNINFSLSRSGFLHMWTETGLIGLASMLLVAFLIVRQLFELVRKNDEHAKEFIFGAVYLVSAFVLFPPSFPVLFLFFVYLGLLVSRTQQKRIDFDFHNNLPAYLVVIFTLAVLLPASAYAYGRRYASEYYFKSSLDALSTGQVAPIYQNLQQAIIMNPYEEKYRLTFSQLNLLVANNIALQRKEALTAQDRQNITQAIQDSIREAKAAVALNPDKASNWENLAIIYQNLLNVAEGADAWSISAYQKAILLDPVNPQLRLALGGVYFSLQQFPNAATFFAQAVSLKPDWTNARYNLAWAYFQNKEYDKAISVMQNVLTLLEKGSPDYAKADADLKLFLETKKTGAQATPKPAAAAPTPTPADQVPSASPEAALELPEKPEAVVSPKIALPTETAPQN